MFILWWEAVTLCLANDSEIEKDKWEEEKAMLMSHKNHLGEAKRVILVKIMQGPFIMWGLLLD